MSIAILLIFAVGFGIYQYTVFYNPPTKRLALDGFYAQMPEDERHKYINLPINHHDSQSLKFRGFYILSPQFNKNEPIIFVLTDGQMELVDTDPDFDFFNNIIGNGSYVLIGRRGHSPTLFPEIYNSNGALDYAKAQFLLGSEQYIEDIELIRQDLINKQLLPQNKKINIFGASGAGILAQQYISKYGQYVDKAILQVTGAPDIAINNNVSYSPDFEQYNPEGDRILRKISPSEVELQRLSNILYQTARSSQNPKQNQINILNQVQDGASLFSYYFKPQYNLSFLKNLLNSPSSVAAKVRYYELVGHDLKKYNQATNPKTNLLYEFSNILLWDFVEQEKAGAISPKKFEITRSDFEGQVLVLSGNQDVVFSVEIGQQISDKYNNSAFIQFDDNHKFTIGNQQFYIDLRNDFYLNGLNSVSK